MQRRSAFFFAALLPLASLACSANGGNTSSTGGSNSGTSSDGGGNSDGGGGGGGGTSKSTTTSNTTSTSSSDGGAPSGGLIGSSTSDTATSTTTETGAGGSCSATKSKAVLTPLDMYIMLDKSGSMTELTANNTTKWAAISAAIDSFVGDTKSAGLGVGIQYFPLTATDAPATCNAKGQCGSYGPCFIGLCQFDAESGVATPCETSSDCSDGDTCDKAGQCANNTQYYCDYSQSKSCGTDDNGNDLGACQKVTTATCSNDVSCTTSDYEHPAVEIAKLPTAASGLTASIAATSPDGNTPTTPALKGAITHASKYAQSHPTDRVVAVLATDGLPTTCDSTVDTTVAVAQEGAAGTPAIPTFVIGIFNDDDQASGAPDNLNQIASAGGTDTAFIVSTDQDVTAQFQAALDKIRGQSLACEYLVPAPPSGQSLDYGKVNVTYTPDSGAGETVGYVETKDKCDATQGGWYYDVDPTTGGTPTKIEICPTSCTAFQNGGSVDIELGCKTQVVNVPQ